MIAVAKFRIDQTGMELLTPIYPDNAEETLELAAAKLQSCCHHADEMVVVVDIKIHSPAR
jgi:hypothetical protein